MIRSRARQGWALPALGVAAVAVAVLAVAAILPQQGLDCGEPYLRSESPDGRHSLTVCRQPMFFAMPGQGGDAPALVVLRNAGGAIEGAVQLSMLGEVNGGPIWTAGLATLPLAAEFSLAHAAAPSGAWFTDRIWRLRSVFGLLPQSSEFR